MPASDTHTFLYRAVDSINASMRVIQLEAAGIDVVTVGGDMLIGQDLRLPESQVEIWVPNSQASEAAAIMHTFDREHGQSTGDNWDCECGESNAPQFQICWRCQTERPAGNGAKSDAKRLTP